SVYSRSTRGCPLITYLIFPGVYGRGNLGVDEHCWKHVRGQGEENFATILVDLTPAIEDAGPARLLDVRAGRSAKVLTAWLDEREASFKDRIPVVTMDGFARYHS